MMGLPLILRQFLLRSGLMLLVKMIGAFGRILLFRFLGAEGMGLYQMVYAFYGLILTLVTAGVPTALSLSTAKNVNKGIRLLKLSAIFLCGLGGAATIISHLNAERIANWYGDSDLAWAIRLLSPVFLIVPLLHLLRGFLQGIEVYAAISFSELVEQLVRVITMCFFVNLWFQYGISVAVGGATLGAVTGGLCALLFLGMYISFYLKLPHFSPAHKADTATFLTISISVLASRLLIPLTDFIDSIIIPNRLVHSGLTVHQSTIVFGEMTGMALTIVYLPTMATSALSHVLTPKIAGNWERNNVKQFVNHVEKAMKVGWLWGMSTSLYFFLYAQDISKAVIGNGSLTYPIICLSFVPLFAGVRDISTNILWVKGEKKAPFIGLVLGSVFSILINYWVVGVPTYQYRGIAMGIFALEVTSLLWNVRYVKHVFSLSLFAESVLFLGMFSFLANILESLLFGYFYIHAVCYFGFTFAYILLRYSKVVIYIRK